MESICRDNRYCEVIERYVLSDARLTELMKEMKSHGLKLTKKQWTRWLTSNAIFKNVQYTEAIRILLERQRLDIQTGRWMFLVLANGILLNLNDVEDYCKRAAVSIQMEGANHVHVLPKTNRHLLFVHLPFEFCQLNDPNFFRCFRRILWFVNVHFSSCFDTGKWIADENGLYNRSETDRSELKELSQLHNTIYEAMERYKRGQESLSGLFTRDAFRQIERIVRINHHRQIPDILGIIRLIQRNTPGDQPQCYKSLVTLLCEQLHALAAKWLQPTDPRIKLFALLKELPQDKQWDPQGHLPMVFDAYCRHLWFTRLGSNEMKAYYSYNQAAFPRAEPGEFYEKFHRKLSDQILTMLDKVDHDLGRYSTATFCLWHTAIHYLLQERRYSDSEVLCRELSKRILGSENIYPQRSSNSPLNFSIADTLGQKLAKHVLKLLSSEIPDFQLLHQGQLCFDAVKTFYLLGSSQGAQARSPNPRGRGKDAQNGFEQALLSFVTALHLRCLTAQPDIWDPLLKSILMALISVGNVLGYFDGVGVWQKLLQAMLSTIEENDKAQKLLENKALARTES